MMPAIGESRSRASLYDFFEDRKPRSAKHSSSVTNRETKDEIATENGDTQLLEKSNDEHLQCLETAITTSDSEKFLLDHVSRKEKRSIRSKTSANKQDDLSYLETGRNAKSDGEFSAGVIVDHLDFQAAGDPDSFAFIQNDDEAVQIDILVEAAGSENDRSTAITDALPSVDIEDAIISDDGVTTSEDDPETESENGYEEEDDDATKDSSNPCESVSDECKVSFSEEEAERRHSSSSGRDEINADFLIIEADSLEIDVDSLDTEDDDSRRNEVDTASFEKKKPRLKIDVYISTDNDLSDEEYNDDEEGRDNLSTGDSPDGNTDDEPDLERSNQDSEGYQDQYDPNSEDDDGLSKTSSDPAIEVDYVWIPSNVDREAEVISGLRETYTPYEPISYDDPQEGNRPQSRDVEDRRSSAFETRLHKTDGEVLMNIPLSTSFIMRNKRNCIEEGAQTVSELMMALQRKRLIEIANEGSEVGFYRTEAVLDEELDYYNEERSEAVLEQDSYNEERYEAVDQDAYNYSEDRYEADTYNYREIRNEAAPDQEAYSEKRMDADLDLNTYNYMEEKSEAEWLHDDKPYKRYQVVQAQPKRGVAVRDETPVSFCHASGKLEDKPDARDAKDTSKKIIKKSPGTKTKFDPKACARNTVSKRLQNLKTTRMPRSPDQPRVTEQNTQKNLRKGPKPVLPAISKGLSKSAGQTTPARADNSRNGRNVRKEPAKELPGTRNVKVRSSPDALRISPKRKTALPSVPIQLHSNACFRNGQVEVEIACDDRLYASDKPLEVQVTFVHKHSQPTTISKPSAYKSKPARKPDKLLSSLTPVNRNIIHQRALWPPFNTYIDREASERYKKIFGNL